MNSPKLFLSGNSVNLRDFRASDIDDALAVIGDDRVTSFLSFDSRTRRQAEAMIFASLDRANEQPRSEFYQAVALPTSDRLIGFVRLALTGIQAAKIGYAIAADYWGNGYATDSVRSILEFGFTSLNLHRVTAAIGPDNGASVSIVRKLGFALEGRLRDHVFTNGSWRDSLLFSVLSEEWAQRGH